MTGKRNNATEQTGPNTSAGAWGLRYPGLVMGTGGKNEVKEFTGMWPLKPDADLVAFTKALAPRSVWVRPSGETFSDDDDEARADPNGALVRRQDAGLRRLYPVLRFSVRWHPREVLRRLRSQREGELGGDLGQLRRLPDRPGCDGARHRASTSHAVRSRPWPVTTSFRASASARSTRRLTGTRRRRSSSVRSLRATATSRTRSMPSSRSWPSRTSPC